MQIHALTTLALLLLSILLGATIARPRGMGPGEDMVGLLANPMIGLPDYGDPEGLINISPDMLLQTLGGETGAAGELGEQMPLVPETFASPHHLRSYLTKLHAYYAIAGRPRYSAPYIRKINMYNAIQNCVYENIMYTIIFSSEKHHLYN